MNMAKAFGTAILALAIVLTGCDPQVSNIQMRRGVKADGTVGSGGPPVTNQTLIAPTGVNTTVLSTGRIRVSWNAVPGATSYRVYYGDPNDSTMRYYVIVTAPSTSWEDNDALATGHTYYYQVQAVNAAGEGPVSGLTQQAYTSTPSVSNPFIGTWVSTLYYDSYHGSGPYFPKTETFSDSTFTFYYHETGESGSGTYTYSGNRATMYVTTPVQVTWYGEITAPNTLKVSYGSDGYHIFTRR